MKQKSKQNITLSIILFILLVILISPLKERIQKISGLKEKDLHQLTSVEIKWKENLQIKPYDDQVLLVDEKEVTSYNYDQEKLWKRDINYAGDTYLGADGIYVNDILNNSINKINLKGDDVWSHDIRYPTYTLTEIDNNIISYFKVNEKDRGISILDKNGKLILTREKSKEEIISSNISKDKKRIIITSMDNSSEELKSKLTYLKSNGDTIWTEEVKGKIIYNVLFMKDNRLLLVGDKDIICKDETGKNLWKKEINYNLKDIEVIGEDKIHILYGNDESELEVLDIDGELDYQKKFKKEYKEIEKLEEDILLLGNEGIIGLKDKKISLRHDIKGKIKDVKKIDDYIVISKEENTDIFKIVDKKSK